jgi:hypothetical protein
MAEKTYIATEPLYVGTARAHNPGDVVPADNVERHGWQDGVATEGTKAAKAAQESPVEDRTAPAQAPAES